MADKLWKAFERWVGTNIFDGAKRNMGSGAINKRDNGEDRTGDVIHDVYEIECKCYSKIAIFRWWDKLAEEAKKSKKIPVLVMKEKGDNKDVLVTIHYTHFNELKRLAEIGRKSEEDKNGKDAI